MVRTKKKKLKRQQQSRSLIQKPGLSRWKKGVRCSLIGKVEEVVLNIEARLHCIIGDQMGEVSRSSKEGPSMKATLATACVMDLEEASQAQARFIKEASLKIKWKAKVSSVGQMGASSKESIWAAKSMARENSSRPTAKYTKENSRTMSAMASASCTTQMESAMKATGATARRMAKEPIASRTVPATEWSTLTARRRLQVR